MTDIQPQSNEQIDYEVLPDDYALYDLNFKVIVVGDASVGKSCLANKATKNIFDNSYNPTIGFEFFSFNIKIDNKVIKLQIWDTCGQEVYRSLISNFYRNSSLAIMVYSINSKKSFLDIDAWFRELRTHSNPDAKVFLIGNKVDLEDEREVQAEEAEKFKEDNGLHLFMETSAKTGFNAQKLFIEAAKLLYSDYKEYKEKLERGIGGFRPLTNAIENKRLTVGKKEDKNAKCGC